jgi:hypothetical protein
MTAAHSRACQRVAMSGRREFITVLLAPRPRRRDIARGQLVGAVSVGPPCLSPGLGDYDPAPARSS